MVALRIYYLCGGNRIDGMTKDNTVEEIVEEIVYRTEPVFREDTRQLLTTYAEQVRREERHNFRAKIEEANFGEEVAERTGDANAVYEVQNVIRKIKALSDKSV